MAYNWHIQFFDLRSKKKKFSLFFNIWLGDININEWKYDKFTRCCPMGNLFSYDHKKQQYCFFDSSFQKLVMCE